jgi:hypothetical protein
MALSTIFTLSSASWHDPDGDTTLLLYTFSYINAAGTTIRLGEDAAGRNATTRSFLPAGNLILCVTVTDPHGGSSTMMFNVTVAPIAPPPK